jgi:hypothetical protein
MRSDMHHLLVERPRGGYRGGHDSRSARRSQTELGSIRTTRDVELIEDAAVPLRSSTARETRKTKWLSENLAPLARFLASRVGRRWDAVYGEIRAQVDFHDPIRLHILQHLWGYVARHVVIIDGVPHDLHWGPLHRFRFHNHFYVCPTSGLLLRVPERPRREPPDPSAAALRRRRRKRRGSRR